MPPLFSASDLHSLNNHLPPDCMDILKEMGLLHRRRPPHRGSGHVCNIFMDTSHPSHNLFALLAFGKAFPKDLS
ncbi:hypothetical protein KUCAC02_005691 [Chaenocephalus aceratus]|uniref:Uncharacterized protein n=1 Tax=Chaenocephalus aceratus TaxID=36190 RepID=A0ACB9WQU1_CHAAC|nr:hypothetical protein KUCAC02_005691 [Chaenocephalus aceratus]